LYISRGHNFFGHHGQPPGEYPMVEQAEIECVAAHGIRGDRFFDFKENYRGQITFFSSEVYEAACLEFSMQYKTPAVFRRNVITQEVELNQLVGVEFEVQGVRFRGTEQCAPCYWMNTAFAPETEAFLKGRGGLRAVILSNGTLHVSTQ
jgi:MOSC domain-containing protein YiiM